MEGHAPDEQNVEPLCLAMMGQCLTITGQCSEEGLSPDFRRQHASAKLTDGIKVAQRPFCKFHGGLPS